MLLSRTQQRIFVYSVGVDMRKSYNGLISEVHRALNEDAQSGNMFVFFNRRKTLLKMLWWDRTGWCLLSKKLERGTFELRSKDSKQILNEKELQLLLDGVFRRRK